MPTAGEGRRRLRCKEIAVRVVAGDLVPRERALPAQTAQAAGATEEGPMAGVREPGGVRGALVGEDRCEVARATPADRAVRTRLGAMRPKVVPARDEHVDIAGHADEVAGVRQARLLQEEAVGARSTDRRECVAEEREGSTGGLRRTGGGGAGGESGDGDDQSSREREAARLCLQSLVEGLAPYADPPSGATALSRTAASVSSRSAAESAT